MNQNAEHTPTQPEQTFLKRAKQAFNRLLGDTGETFESDIWDITALEKKKYHGNRKLRLLFGPIDAKDDPIPPRVNNIIKAYVILMDATPGARINYDVAIRYLYQTLRNTYAGTNIIPDWSHLSNDTLRIHQVWLLNSGKKYATVYGLTKRAIAFANHLSDLQISQPIRYQHGLQSDSTRNITDERYIENRKSRLPKPEVVNAIADHAFTTEDIKLKIPLLVALLAIYTGLRINEIVTLPAQCEITDDDKYKIRYHASKPMRYLIFEVPKWNVEIVKKIIGELRRLSEKPRQRAKIQEGHSERVPIPGYQPADQISSKDLARIMGGTTQQLTQRMLKAGVRIKSKSKAPPRDRIYYYSIAEVERALARHLPKTNDVVVYQAGRKQTLSQSLFAQFRQSGSQANPNPLIVELVTAGAIRTKLRGSHGKHRSASVFEVLGLFDADTKAPMSFFPHQGRHYYVNAAYHGGAGITEIAMHQNRQDIEQTRQYIHTDNEKMIEALRQRVRDNEATGYLADAYWRLPDTQKEPFLVAFTQHVHVTPLGYCLHDDYLEGCPKANACLQGCTDYIPPTKNEPKELQALYSLGQSLVTNLAHEVHMSRRQSTPIVEKWVEDVSQMVQGTLAALPDDLADDLRVRLRRAMPNIILLDDLMAT